MPGIIGNTGLTFLINTENHRPIRRRKVETDDVANLVDEERIAGQLEAFHSMRLKAECRPDPSDRRVRQAHLLTHRTDRPMGSVGGCRVEGPFDHRRDLIVFDAARTPGSRFIQKPVNPIL
jgi:hypothetical protein